MDKLEIVEKLNPIVSKPNFCGFGVYLLTKSEPRLKILKLSRNGLQPSLKAKMIECIKEKYISKEVSYVGSEYMIDNQEKYYVVEQTNEYKPFDIASWEMEDFKEDHLNDFMGFMFQFRYDQQEVWGYQKKRSITLSNRKNMNVIAKLLKFEDGYKFEEQREKIMSFVQAIDILVIDGVMITKDIGLLERSFDFQNFIREKALEAAKNVEDSKLFFGMDKLYKYLSSDAKSHKPYCKKMMKTLDSPILQMASSELFSKVATLPRWKDKFRNPVDGKIPIETNREIESMIDLLIERFTVSEVSGQEYDTDVKKKAEP